MQFVSKLAKIYGHSLVGHQHDGTLKNLLATKWVDKTTPKGSRPFFQISQSESIIDMTLLGIDTESGGITTDYDLLTLTMCVIKDYEIVKTLDMKLKPNPVDGRSDYFVQAEALAVNGINIAEHDWKAMPYRQSKQIIFDWLEEAKNEFGKLLPFGNGVSRDIQLITKYTVSPPAWEMVVMRNPIELTSIGNNLKMLGLIPMNQSLALSKIATYFGVEIDEEKVHTAEYDVWLGTQVLKHYNQLITK